MYVWKSIKVFLSSTYLDLELERDYLADIFTRLRKELMPRHLSLIPYDLRWHERHSQASIPQWCLDKLKQCQYFVSILGYRYGWRPPLLENGQPNTKKFSITEMEIREAQARLPKSQRLFCFGLLDQYEPDKIAQVSSEDRQSVEKLKQSLKIAGEHIIEFRNQAELLAIVENELRNIFQRDYPESAIVAPVEYGVSEAQNAFLQEKIRGFVGRIKYLQELEKFAKNVTYPNYLGIHAVAGTGKSSLLAKFVEQWQKQNPEVPIISHFMGMSSNSRQLSILLLWLAQQLQNYQIITDPIATDIGQLRQQIRQALEQCPRRLIITIDGLDEMESSGHNLLWLPRQLPSCVRVILTTRPVDPWPLLKTYPRLQMLELAPLYETEITEIIQHYSDESGLQMSGYDIELLQKRAAGNPLYLKVALEQIGIGGVAVGQLATSIDSLFEQILQRLGKQYGTALVWDYVGLITASRYGLTESEMRELLATNILLSQSNLDNTTFQTESAQINTQNTVLLNNSTQNLALPNEPVQNVTASQLPNEPVQNVTASQLPNEPAQNITASQLPNEPAQNITASQLPNEPAQNITASQLPNEPVQNVTASQLPNEPAQNVTASQAVYSADDLLVAVAFSLQNFLIERGGLFDFFHAEFERMLKERIGKGNMRKYHQRLAQYFQSKGFDYPRSLLELPYQQQWGEQYESLLATLTNLNFLQKKSLSGLCDGLLEDIIRATEDLVVRIPKYVEIQITPNLYANYTTLQHLGKMLQLDLHFLQQHPNTLFQCLWNRGFWYDAPHTSSYYTHSKIYPGHDTRYSIMRLVEYWREQISSDHLTWAKTLRPLNPYLDSPVLKILRGHTKPITSIAWNKEGHRIASSAKDGFVKIWDHESGECLLTLQGHEGEVNAVIFSEQGQKIISAGSDHLILVWDAQTGACLEIILGHQDAVLSLAITQDQSTLVSASNDGTIRVWNLNSNYKQEQVISSDSNGLLSVVITKDGKTIIAAANDNSIRVWNRETGKRLALWQGHEAQIQQLAISDDGRTLASVANDGMVKLWDIASHQLLQKFAGHSGKVTSVCLTKIDKNVAEVNFLPETIQNTTTKDSNLPKKDLVAGTAKEILENLANLAIISGAIDNTIRVWHAKDLTPAQILEQTCWQVTSLALHSNGYDLLAGAEDGTISLWDLHNPQANLILAGPKNPVTQWTISQDHTMAIAGSEDTKIYIWNLRDGRLDRTLSGHIVAVQSVAQNDDQHLLASGSEDGVICLWNLLLGKLQTSWTAHKGRVMRLKFLSNNSLLSIGYFDEIIKIWNLSINRCSAMMEGHERWIEATAFSKSAQILVTGSRDKTARVWNIETATCLHVLRGHSASVTAVALSPDEKLIATGAHDGLIRIWDIEKGSSWMVLRGHRDSIQSIAFSDNGQWIISSSRDHITIIWDSQKGEIVSQFAGMVNALEVGRSSTPYFTLTRAWETAIISKDYLYTHLSLTKEAEIAYFPIPLVQTTFFSPNRCIGIGQIENQSISMFEINK